MRALLASPLGFLIGVSLGALGGGGSILAVPALVYAAGQTPKHATTTSLVLVALTAMIGIVPHWRAGRVRFAAGAMFGLAGIGGSLLGSHWNKSANPDVLLLAFSGLMLVAAYGMWRRARNPQPCAPLPSVGAAAAPPAAAMRSVRIDTLTTVKVIVAGTIVGFLTGFFGVGGGFVIVPALVLALGFSMPEAVGTSLLVIAINSGVALTTRLQAGVDRMGHRDPLHDRQPARRDRRQPLGEHPRFQLVAAMVRRTSRGRRHLHSRPLRPRAALTTVHAHLADDAREDLPSARGQLHPLLKMAIGIAVGGAAIWLVVSTAGGIGDALEAMNRMQRSFVALALAMATLRLGLYGRQLALLARHSGRLGVRTALGLALVVYGFGAVTPAAPAEGLAIASHELRRRGRSKRQALLTVGFSEWFAQRTFYAVAAIDLILVVVLGHLTIDGAWPFVIVAFVVLVALTGTSILARRPKSADRLAVLLHALRIGRPQPPPEARRQLSSEWHADAMTVVGSPGNRARLAIVSALAVLADAATLWATCHAAGIHIHPELAVLAATVGTMVSWVPLLPSGLGLVEAAIPAILHRFGAPLDDALAATLVYRAVGTLMPALAGGLAIGALRSRRSTAE